MGSTTADLLRARSEAIEELADLHIEIEKVSPVRWYTPVRALKRALIKAKINGVEDFIEDLNDELCGHGYPTAYTTDPAA